MNNTYFSVAAFLIAATITATPLLTLSAAANAAAPVPFNASYETTYGIMSARGERKLEPAGDGMWKMQNGANVLLVDVIERSTFLWQNGHVVSHSYDYTNPLNQDRSISLSFDWSKNTVTNNGSKHTLQLQPNVFDKLSYQIQMQMNVCSNPDKYPGDNFTVVDRKRLKTYRVELVGRDTQKTPAGTLNTIHLKQFRPDKRDGKDTHIWLAADWSCLLVRLDQYEGNDIISLKLVKATVNGAEVKSP